MKRRMRHMLILIGVPLLLTLAIGGWIVDGARKPITLLQHTRRPQLTKRARGKTRRR